MRFRYIALLCGLAFFGGLGVVIGQRMMAEAMAVMVGVMAGTAASIPTSLMVVWFATRHQTPAEPLEPERPFPVEPPDPRAVWMPTQAMLQPQMRYQNFAGYPPFAYPVYPYPVESMPGQPLSGPPVPAPRHFTVIGGADTALDDLQTPPEVIWPQR